MNLIRRDLWSMGYDGNKDVLILIPANNVVKSDGRLVMGAGFARQVCLRHPGIDLTFGKLVSASRKDYLLIATEQQFGLIQTKLNWRDPSPIELVQKSIKRLMAYAIEHPARKIAMPMPGSGNGGLREQDVLPDLESLPNWVEVFVW